ncbi:MAG: type I pantothenate kinase [Candidatus Tokpelaia sp. JSC161]|jgi:type I pantothenate kinase|nr:MAG: type I pantothenate kinase [Candidatus Tokpelaia sp. JSC161]
MTKSLVLKDQTKHEVFSKTSFLPYNLFSAEEWARFRADTALTLTYDEVERLRSIGDPINLEEVQRIYLSLSRLLSSHVESSQKLFLQRHRFLQMKETIKTPFILAIAGSVAVGKSTTARILEELLKRWPSSPKVKLVTTDGFLYPNSILQKQNRMNRKGFPESYDAGSLIQFLSDIKSGRPHVKAPLYSHLLYDVLEKKYITIHQPDILIIEGVNVLQVNPLARNGNAMPFVSDFFDFSIYIDAEIVNIHQWYIQRFLKLRQTAFKNPQSFFHRYANMKSKEALHVAEKLWIKINLKNLIENILPTRPRADLILHKGQDHMIQKVALRKL